MKISHIIGREILDSRGNPTVEAEVWLEDGQFASAKVPAGASIGSHEAHELRDGDAVRFGGAGVSKAVSNISGIIAPDLVGLTVDDYTQLDARLLALDGTKNKEHLGANAVLAVSIACVKAAALAQKKTVYQYLGGDNVVTLPLPLMNIINGGKHASDSTEFQEFMIMPIGADTFKNAMQMGLEVYHALKGLIKDQKLSTTVGDEGGFGLPNATNEQALQILVQAIELCSYKVGEDIALGIDAAASEFYQQGQYVMKREQKMLDSAGMQAYMKELVQQFPIRSIEDPLAEDDWEGFARITAEFAPHIQVAGDDLFATDPNRLQNGINLKAANAIMIKPNQIGTVTETIQTINLAKQNNITPIISHRSGDTVDPFIADLCVALEVGQIKTGSPARGERVAKYNQLLRIEEALGARAVFAGF